MIQGIWFPPGTDLSVGVLPVRRAVFGSAGNNTDPESWNILVYMDDQPAASGRIWWADGAFHLGDIGVIPELRGRRLGDLALRLLLFKAQSHAAREVRLRCGCDTEGFFARLGFCVESRTRDTVEMVLAGKDINLDSCTGCLKQNCPDRK